MKEKEKYCTLYRKYKEAAEKEQKIYRNCGPTSFVTLVQYEGNCSAVYKRDRMKKKLT
jgi:hypothetical protein